MSRGQRKKIKLASEFYPTPEWVTRRLLENSFLPKRGVWLEPAVGDGAIMRVVREHYPNVTWHTNDIRPESLLHASMNRTTTHYTGDFLKLAPCVKEKYDCIITNPPFSLALEFVKASLPIANNVLMLLRLGFLESTSRNAWIRRNMPDFIYVLPNRQGGTSDGKTDVFTYAWFHWKPVWLNDEIGQVSSSEIVVLPNTPAVERKRDRAKLATQDSIRAATASNP